MGCASQGHLREGLAWMWLEAGSSDGVVALPRVWAPERGPPAAALRLCSFLSWALGGRPRGALLPVPHPFHFYFEAARLLVCP